jgi:hypothetical protein
MSFSTHSPILFSSEYVHYKIFIHEKCLEKLNDNLQQNLSQRSKIDARARYRAAAPRLRNIGLDLSWAVAPGKKKNKLGFHLWRERKGETCERLTRIQSSYIYMGKKDDTIKRFIKWMWIFFTSTDSNMLTSFNFRILSSPHPPLPPPQIYHHNITNKN